MIAIYANKEKDNNYAVSEKILKLLKAKNTDGVIFKKPEEIKAPADVLAVIGGDGTILSVIPQAVKYNLPVVGINFGGLGFLTEFEDREVSEAVDFICGGDKIKEEKTLLNLSFKNKNYLALNEVTLSRIYNEETSAQVAYIEAKTDGLLIDRYIADGLIVSTPTGSTAYSLSAGGSVLSPSIKAFSLIPICAHSLRSRPVIFPDDKEITLNLFQGDTDAGLFVDGRCVAKVKNFEEAKISKSEKTITFLRRPGYNFYGRLHRKMNKW